MDITVVLTNWKRSKNLKEIIVKLTKQTLKPRIFLWNNGGTFYHPGIDWQVDSSANMKTRPRWFMASMAETEYVCIMDDDLIFVDNHILEDAAAFLENKDKDVIIGPYGVDFGNFFLPYTQCCSVKPIKDKDQNADMIKGRLMILRTKALIDAHFIAGAAEDLFRGEDIKIISEDLFRGDDIKISSIMAKGKRKFHRVPSLFYSRLKDLPSPFALCDEDSHKTLRNRAKCRFFKPSLLK